MNFLPYLLCFLCLTGICVSVSMSVPLFGIYLFPHLLCSACVHLLLFVRVCMSLLCIVFHIHLECCRCSSFESCVWFGGLGMRLLTLTNTHHTPLVVFNQPFSFVIRQRITAAEVRLTINITMVAS